ncbi:MAG: aminoglycoside phosphotransferase family protein [Defluviitaleaceae bacterium]|nr:aminoglycoside phosphotransferase family protein [Defluviitaleaceae bacterium]
MNSDKIIEHFGAVFHDKVIVNLPKYAERWNLSNLEQIDYYSLSCLFTCDSTEYGACVLKFGMHLEISETEYYMLKDFDGNGLCKVYESDINNGTLLIECIRPGTQLSDEPDQHIRLTEFCALLQKLHRTPTDIAKYPSYMDWVSDMTTFIKTRSDYTVLYNEMVKAEKICRQLWGKYTGRLLLHGDLHHENILLGKDGYYAIDPLGVIGDPVFDIPLFILEEVDWGAEGEYDSIVKTISTKLNVSEQDIRTLVYIESCRANCCCVEDGDYDEVDMGEIFLAERMMNTEAATASAGRK